MARPIFRVAALRRHNDRLEKVELPRYAAPTWTWFWLACGLLLAVAGALLWTADVPVYTTGPGFVGEADRRGRVTIVALLPAEHAPQLAAGQPARVVLRAGGGATRELEGKVAAVEAEPLSPADARTRYALAEPPAEPVVMLRATLDEAALAAMGQAAALWRGAPVEIRVATGTRSGLSLLPGAGRLFGAEEQ